MNAKALLWLLVAIVVKSICLWVGWNYVIGPLCHWGRMLPWQAVLLIVCWVVAGLSVSGWWSTK